MMDYIAYDAAAHRVWVPAGNTGSVDAIDVRTGAVARVEGFKTKEVERNGKKRTVGPSSVTVGKGVIYAGNRADQSVCAADEATLTLGACVSLDSSPDGIAYVDLTSEVWVTTPRDKSLRVLDAKTLAQKAKITLPGEPEGYAVDNARGVFYTNLEDKDRTLVINLKSHAVTATWLPACGEDGPKGLSLDRAKNVLLVACSDHVISLDAGHDGKKLGSVPVGEGVDNIDYVEPRHELFAAAGRAAKLVVAKLGDDGQLTAVATTATTSGARNAVATEDGDAYLIDPPEGAIYVVPATAR